MKTKFDLLHILVPAHWSIKNHSFYNIERYEEGNEWDYLQEDLLWLQKGQYHIDVGWYGGDDFSNDKTGYCIYLFRGESFVNSELLQQFRSRDIKLVLKRIYELIAAVDRGTFDNIKGLSG